MSLSCTELTFLHFFISSYRVDTLWLITGTWFCTCSLMDQDQVQLTLGYWKWQWTSPTLAAHLPLQHIPQTKTPLKKCVLHVCICLNVSLTPVSCGGYSSAKSYVLISWLVLLNTFNSPTNMTSIEIKETGWWLWLTSAWNMDPTFSVCTYSRSHWKSQRYWALCTRRQSRHDMEYNVPYTTFCISTSER